jgi:hypothetical protein
MLSWYTDGFVPGGRYTDLDGLSCLEYAGVLTAEVVRRLIDHPELVESTKPGGRVHVFATVTDSGVVLYTHTRTDADKGYGFVRLPDTVHRSIDDVRACRQSLD